MLRLPVTIRSRWIAEGRRYSPAMLALPTDDGRTTGDPPLGWLTSAASGFAIAISDGTVWLSIGQALLFAAVCLLFGICGRSLRRSAAAPTRRPAETWESGWRPGLLVLAAWWAAVASGGRSSFTPVAVGFAIAIGLAVGPPSATIARSSEADRERVSLTPT